MAEYFNMGGYAVYVWVSYVLTFVVLIAHVVAPLMRRKRVLNEISRRIRREQRQQQAEAEQEVA